MVQLYELNFQEYISVLYPKLSSNSTMNLQEFCFLYVTSGRFLLFFIKSYLCLF